MFETRFLMLYQKSFSDSEFDLKFSLDICKEKNLVLFFCAVCVLIEDIRKWLALLMYDKTQPVTSQFVILNWIKFCNLN
jgi:hypothetical protein